MRGSCLIYLLNRNTSMIFPSSRSRPLEVLVLSIRDAVHFIKLRFLFIFFSLHPDRERIFTMMPLTSLVQYLTLKNFVLYVLLPLVGMVVRWACRWLVGVDKLDSKFTNSPLDLPSSSTTLHLLNLLPTSIFYRGGRSDRTVPRSLGLLSITTILSLWPCDFP
jgi:hypothetical protein